jgi:small subunit ribosomal protein S6
VIDELEKNESIDKKLLRYLTVKVKKFDLDTNYFSKKEESEKKEITKS